MDLAQTADPGANADSTEEEVTFEEEVDPDKLGYTPFVPEYRHSPWLLLLPLACALLLAWNVRWRPKLKRGGAPPRWGARAKRVI